MTGSGLIGRGLGEQLQEAAPTAATGDAGAEGLAVDEPVTVPAFQLDGSLLRSVGGEAELANERAPAPVGSTTKTATHSAAWPCRPMALLLAYQRAAERAHRSKCSRPHCLLRWSFSRSFHQALLNRTRPDSTESLPNLTWPDRTGP
jgi:hypothetical protein